MNILHIKMFTFLLSIFLVLACAEDDPKVTPELELGVSLMSFTKDGQQKSFKLTSNVNWSIESTGDWCVVSPASGEAGANPIKVTTVANPTTDIRTAELIVSAGDLTETISITQAQSYLLALTETTFNLSNEAQEITISFIRSDNVDIIINNDWITQKELKAEVEDEKTFVIEANGGLLKRKGTITFKLDDIIETVTVNQNGVEIFAEPDMTGIESTASELAAKMMAGWNVGNSLEVPGGETGWNNPAVTKILIDAVKAAGFNAVRIPCAWDGYIVDRETYEISDAWLARVKEVIGYCRDNDMYVIINTHWDGGWLEEHPIYEKQDEINEQLYALWQQIAVYFRNYDEHLLFAGTNEVHENYNEPSAENIEVQESFNQTFVDAVRSTGGKNAYRNLIIQTYNTNIGWGIKYHTMPADQVENRLFVEVHYYDPYQFTLADSDYNTQWGQGYTDVSSWGQEDYLQEQFGEMKEKYADNGIPVILGEYGAKYRSNLSGETLQLHEASRNYFLKTVTGTARATGMVPFIWDNGGDDFGLFDRNTGEQVRPGAVEAILTGAGVQ